MQLSLIHICEYQFNSTLGLDQRGEDSFWSIKIIFQGYVINIFLKYIIDLPVIM